jgi:glutamate/tyrosine decarboxylase-like PLP-dependent enzyme
MVPDIRTQMNGLEDADSITLDPHKWLYCPMGVGCAFVRDVKYLNAAFSATGNYLKDLENDEVNFFDRGPELSRPARVLPVWMLIRTAGVQQLRHQICEDIRLAKLAATLLAEDDRFEVQPVRLSIVVFRHRAQNGESEIDRVSRDDALIEAILADGELMLSSTVARGVNCLRLVVMNHRTNDDEVRRSVKRIRKLAFELAKRS